ncbi:MAG: hypothetical protein KDA79_11575 [Planctomycetaceae bacterium]|nr:hypothetical protein [Planctomycetaceae bacterium]
MNDSSPVTGMPLTDATVNLFKGGTLQTTFTLTEQFAFGSHYSWRLKESEIRFRGSGEFAQLVIRRIPASDAQVEEFFAAVEFLQVREWRSDYHPGDINQEVLDGSSWSFTASVHGLECCCGGENAYPSFADPEFTTTGRGRFGLLHAAMYDCFEIESYIRQARLLAEATKQRSVDTQDRPN